MVKHFRRKNSKSKKEKSDADSKPNKSTSNNITETFEEAYVIIQKVIILN